MRIRIRRGTALVNKVLKNFDRAIEDLAVAAQDIAQRRETKKVQLEQARESFKQYEVEQMAADAHLRKALTRAEQVRANLEALVGR